MFGSKSTFECLKENLINEKIAVKLFFVTSIENDFAKNLAKMFANDFLMIFAKDFLIIFAKDFCKFLSFLIIINVINLKVSRKYIYDCRKCL